MAKRRLAIAGLVLISGSLLASGPAEAQYSADQLSTILKDKFDKVYADGTLGVDWCYNAQTERTYTYWYADFASADGKSLEGVQVRLPVRVQALYKDAGITKYSSIFIGLESTTELRNFAFAPPQNAKPDPDFKPMKSTPSPKLKEPAQTTCMSLGDFLKAYVMPYRLLIQDDPSTAEVDQQTFAANPYKYRYWVFGGRPHQIRGVTRFKIGLEEWDSGDAIKGDIYFVVGFGGGAGP